MGRNTFYSFGLDMAAQRRDWIRDTMVLAYEIRGRTWDLGIIDDGNFRLAGTQTGRMSCVSTNLSSRGHSVCGVCNRAWGTCVHSNLDFDPLVDDEAMQMICEKAGETTSMTDPYTILKYNGPPDRRRAYG